MMPNLQREYTQRLQREAMQKAAQRKSDHLKSDRMPPDYVLFEKVAADATRQVTQWAATIFKDLI